MFKKRFIFCIFSLFILAACSGGQTTSSGSDQSSSGTESQGTSQNNDAPLAPGVTDKEILIGMTGPQSGPAAAYSVFMKGALSYFNYVNANGGVNGRTIKTITYDDQYQPAKTVQFTKKLVEEDKVFALVALTGTPGNLAIKDYVVQTGIPNLMAGTGSPEFFEPLAPNIIGSAAMNFITEDNIMMYFTVNQLGAKKIAIAYQNDDSGMGHLGNMEKIVNNYPGVEIVDKVSFFVADTDLSSQAQKLANAEADVIMFLGNYSPAANLKKAMEKINLNKPFVVTNAAGSSKTVIELAGKDVWEGTYSPLTMLPPDRIKDGDIFLEQFTKDYPKDNPSSAQPGWASGQIFVEALKRTGDDLTWDNLLNSFYSFDNWDGSFFPLVNFTEKNHYGTTTLYMSQVKNGEFEILDIFTFDPIEGKVSTAN